MTTLILLAHLLSGSAPALDLSPFAARLDSLAAEHDIIMRSPSVEGLVRLDLAIRDALAWLPKRPPGTDAKVLWKDDYRKIGLFLAARGGALGYSGRLLVEAHALDPESSFRELTLFSQVFDILPESGLGVMPNVDAAKAYLEEFPEGYFARDVTLILSAFYKDLYIVLRDSLGGRRALCFAPHIVEGAWDWQAERARVEAIRICGRLLKKSSGDEIVGKRLQELRQRTARVLSFCVD